MKGNWLFTNSRDNRRYAIGRLEKAGNHLALIGRLEKSGKFLHADWSMRCPTCIPALSARKKNQNLTWFPFHFSCSPAEPIECGDPSLAIGREGRGRCSIFNQNSDKIQQLAKTRLGAVTTLVVTLKRA